MLSSAHRPTSEVSLVDDEGRVLVEYGQRWFSATKGKPRKTVVYVECEPDKAFHIVLERRGQEKQQPSDIQIHCLINGAEIDVVYFHEDEPTIIDGIWSHDEEGRLCKAPMLFQLQQGTGHTAPGSEINSGRASIESPQPGTILLSFEKGEWEPERDEEVFMVESEQTMKAPEDTGVEDDKPFTTILSGAKTLVTESVGMIWRMYDAKAYHQYEIRCRTREQLVELGFIDQQTPAHVKQDSHPATPNTVSTVEHTRVIPLSSEVSVDAVPTKLEVKGENHSGEKKTFPVDDLASYKAFIESRGHLADYQQFLEDNHAVKVELLTKEMDVKPQVKRRRRPEVSQTGEGSKHAPVAVEE